MIKSYCIIHIRLQDASCSTVVLCNFYQSFLVKGDILCFVQKKFWLTSSMSHLETRCWDRSVIFKVNLRNFYEINGKKKPVIDKTHHSIDKLSDWRCYIAQFFIEISKRYLRMVLQSHYQWLFLFAYKYPCVL